MKVMKLSKKLLSLVLIISMLTSSIPVYASVKAQAIGTQAIGTQAIGTQAIGKSLPNVKSLTVNPEINQKSDCNTADINNTSDGSQLSQAQINQIVNAHFSDLENMQEEKNIDEDDNNTTDRFIVKFKKSNANNEITGKVKDKIKSVFHTKNSRFDVFQTNERLKKEDFIELLKQSNISTEIEYIQPDYQMTMSAEGDLSEEQKIEEDVVFEDEESEEQSPAQVEDTVAPEFEEAVIFENTIRMQFDEALSEVYEPANGDFVITIKDTQGNTTNPEIVSVEIIGVEVVVSFYGQIAADDSITLSYIPGDNLLTDIAGNQVQEFDDITVINNIAESDEIPPTLIKAEINGDTITLSYSEQLKEDSIPTVADYAINVNGESGTCTVESICIEGSNVVILLNNIVSIEEVVKLSYTIGTTPTKDLSNNVAENLQEIDVVNTSEIVDVEGPEVEKGIICVSIITLTFNEQLKESTIPDKSDLIVVMNESDDIAIDSIKVTGKEITLMLDRAIAAGDEVKISYAPGENLIEDLVGNASEGFAEFSLENITPEEINDPYFVEQWGLLANEYQTMELENAYGENKQVTAVGIDAVNAWESANGSSVIVAVLDTGIDVTHEDLSANIWQNTAEIPNNGIDDDGNGYIDDVNGWNFVDKSKTIYDPALAEDEWHGTHIAGIIAAVKGNEKGIVGVAPKAQIMPLPVFKNGIAYTSDIISAIEYAKQMGAQVVNCSWGTTSENIALKEVMNGTGLLFVCAAGNSFRNIDENPVYPAAFTGDNIISVASINKTGNLSRFSNYGANSVDVAAPGEEIKSTLPNDAYGNSGGTSMATAFVSGQAALILSKYPTNSPNDIKARIVDSVDKLSSLTEKVESAGKINCAAAIAEPVQTNDGIIEIAEDNISSEPGGEGTDDGDLNLFAVDEWNARAGMATARRYLGAAEMNGKIYAIGGYNGSNLSTVEEYDPATNVWTTKSSMPTARYGLSVVALNNKIYAIGGYSTTYKTTVEAYDPVSNAWVIKDSMPTGRQGLGIVAVNGKIYAIGGYNGSYLNTVQEYEPVYNTWTTKASMTTAREGLAVISLNNKIYAIGGYNGSYLNTVEEYDPLTNTWSTKASLPTARRYVGAAAINGKGYVIGGTNGTVQNIVEEYNQATDSWGVRSAMPSARYGLGVAALNGKIYAVGGYSSSYMPTLEEYGLPSSSWKMLASMPSSRAGFSAAAVDGKIYVAGGYDGTNYLNNLESFDPATSTWSTMANMSTPRRGLGMVALNGKLYAVGGSYVGYLNTLEEYDPSTNTWTTKASMPTARENFATTVANGKIYAIGGCNGSDLMAVEVYDPATDSWSIKAEMNAARRELGVAMANGKIYAIGGCSSQNSLTTVEEYDPQTNVWTIRTSMAVARRALGTATVYGKIYAIGGYGSGYLTAVEEYDPLANNWTSLSKDKMTQPRGYFGITSCNGKIYVLGGESNSGIGSYLSTVEEFSAITSPGSFKAPLTTSRKELGAVALNGKIYAIGGYESGCLNTVEEYDLATNTWTTKASMPTARRSFGIAVANGKIYVIGGSTNYSTITDNVEEYNPLTNTWATKADMPTSRYLLSAASVKGKIYAIGGSNGSWAIKTVEEYDPIINRWTTKTNMKFNRMGFATTVLNNKIYAIGGWSVTCTNTVEEYDPVANTWTTKAAMLTARENLGAVAANGKIYAVGGDDPNCSDVVEEYDPRINTWSTAPSLLLAKAQFGVAEVNGTMYTIGGYNDSNVTAGSIVEAYDLGPGAWVTKPSMPTNGRKDLGVVAVGDKLYAIGGNSGSTSVNAVEMYDSTNNTWSTRASMPTARDGFGVATVNGKIYAVGGYDGSYKNTVEEYDPDTNIWTTKANLNSARRYLGVAAVNGKIYAIGGYNGTGYLNTVEEYDPVTDTWTTKATMTTARSMLSLVGVLGKVYAIGGYNGSSYLYNVEEYNPVTNTWSTKATMLTARAGTGACVANDKVYVFGGNNGTNNYLDTNEEYDPVNNVWTVKTGMLTTRGSLGAAAISGKLYAVGGTRYETSALVLSTVEVYDPSMDGFEIVNNLTVMLRKELAVVSTDSKIAAIGGYNDTGYINSVETFNEDGSEYVTTQMTISRKELGAAYVNGNIYIVGGYNGTGYLSDLEVFETKEYYNGTWTVKTSMPTARAGLGVIAVNGRIYAIGGQNESGYLSTVEEYDPYSDTWTVKASMPTPRSDFGIVCWNGLIYIFGGRNNEILNSCLSYDPISNKWSIITDLSAPRFDLSAAVLNGKLYAIGGHDGNNYLNGVEEYNPATQKWVAKQSCISPRAGFGAVTLAGKINLVGGNNQSGYLNNIEQYYPGDLIWESRAPISTARSMLGAAVVNGKIYAIGGYNGSSLSTVEEYDPATNTWTTKADMPTARAGLGVAVVNNRIYAIGGFDGSTELGTVQVYYPTLNTWYYRRSMPYPRANLSVVAVNGKIYAIGGNNGTTQVNTVLEYDPSTNTWKTKASMPTSRDMLGATAIGGKIYGLGGQKDDIGTLDVLEEYDPVTNLWSTKTHMVGLRRSLGVVALSGKIYALGGNDGGNESDLVQVYDPSTDSWTKEAGMLNAKNDFAAVELNGEIYVIGGDSALAYSNTVEVGSYGEEETSALSELIHLGEENVNPSGNFSRSYTDMELKAPGFEIDLTRTYNSRDYRTDGPLPLGWSFSFQGSLKDSGSNQFIARMPNGSAMSFSKNADNSYTANDSRATLVKQGDDTHILTTKDQYTYGFDVNGWLNWMKDRDGNTITLTVNAATGKVTAITDQVGRQIAITYNAQGYIDTIIDPLNRSVQYGYTNNLLTLVTNPQGKVTYYSYNDQGYLETIKDNDNNTLESVVYDTSSGSLPKIARLTDVYGNIQTYMYDPQYRKVTITDTNDRETITWYDSSLYPIQAQDADGRRSTSIYTLDANNVNQYGEVESVIDRNGNKTEYERDSQGNITKIYNPDSSYKEFTYDDKNNKISEKDENGKYTFYIYDDNKLKLLKQAQPLNGTDVYTQGCNEDLFAITTYAYYTDAEAQQMGCNAKGLLKSETDPNGHATTYTYDTYGNIITSKDAEDKITTYVNNTIGWQTSAQTPKQYTTSYVYDHNGNIEKVTLQGGEVTRITYDNMGRKIKEVSAELYNPVDDDLANHAYNGDVGYRYTYYSSGKLHTVTDPEDNQTVFTYDSYGNLLTETKPNGAVYEYGYDSLDRPTTTKFKENAGATAVLLSSNSYLILADGKSMKTETQYLNNSETAVTEYIYDYEDRLIRQNEADGSYSTVNYNANGTISSTRDGRGNSTYYAYDGLNRNTQTWSPLSYSGGTLYTYEAIAYDKAGNILEEKTGKTAVALNDVPASGDFITVTNEYYADDNLKKQTDSAGRRTDYLYDDDGCLIQKDVYTSSTEKNITEYINNYFGKPDEVTIHVREGDLFGNDFSSNADTEQTTSYTYDKNGNVETVTQPDDVVTTYTYDNMNRQTSISMPGMDENNNPVTITTSITYDWSGKILTQTDANNHVTTNTYTKQGQLATVTDAKNYTAAFYYDRAGRLVAEVAPNNYDSGKTMSQMSRTEYTYDAMDRVKTKGYNYLDPSTQQWVSFIAKAYKYDGNGNKLKELDALGYEAGSGSVDEKINTGYGTEYTYDLANNITSVLDPVNKDRSLSFTTQYQYDGAGRKITETNAKDIDTVYTYDDADNILTISVDGHIIQENTYDLTGNLLTQTDGNDNTVTNEYNAFNQLKKAQFPGDTTIAASNITYQYDTKGNMKKSVNSAGPVDVYTYNNQGRQLSHTQEKADATQSITTSVRYDKAGNQRFVIDGNGVTRENIYNEVNKLVESKITVTNVNNVSADQSTYYGFDASGNQVTQTDWLGNTYTSVYDPLNRLIEKKDPLNKSIEKLEYNHNSVQIKSYDALNKLTQFTYDKNNRRLSTIDPLNHTKSQTYDEVGNVKTASDGLNNVTNYNYDEFNRLSSVVNAKNETTSYTYDLNGNMLTQTDGAGYVTTFEYNAANKVIRKIDHGGRTGTAPNYTYDAAKTESYTYNADGTLAIKTDRNGETTSYTFDVHGRKLSEEAGSITITYTYDGNSNQLTMTDGTGTTTRTYDQLNRTKSKAVPGAGTLTFLYDVTTGLPAGQVKEIDTDPRSNITAQVFDKAGRIIQVIADGNTTGYAYYDNGAKQSVTLPSGAVEEFAYYDDGMLYTLVNKKADQTVIDAYTYTYDAAHNMTSKVDAVGATSYTYDDLNRLHTVTEPSTKVTTYTFDDAGNRATQTVTMGTDSEVTTYTCNEQNRLTAAEVKLNNVTTKTVVYTYDNNGNQTLITTTPYVNGIPQTPEITICTYDELNQLTTTEMPNGDIINNTYAGDGFRVAKQVNGTTTKYVYIGDKVVLELDGAGNQIAKNVQGTTMISRTVGGTTLYYMFNGHADVSALIDATDAIQATYYYDAFGNILSSTGSANNPYTYAGYQYDEETGYYYLQSRFYDPITARFLSEDTYRGDPNDPLSLNLYTYCHNEPIKYTDPTGHYIDETTLGTLVKEGYTSVVLVYEPGKGDTLIVTGKGMTLTITDNRKDVRYDPIDTVHDLSCYGNEKKSSDIKSTGKNKTDKKANSPTPKIPATQTTPTPAVKTPTAAEFANTIGSRDDYLWMLEHGYFGKQGTDNLILTDKMKNDGVNIVTVNGIQYSDYSKPINSVFWDAAVEASNHNGDLNWFKSKVNHKADWDIKRKDSWEKTVGTPFPGSYDTKIVVNESITTPEELGNMMYGYTGTAADISETVLIGGSMYAAGIWGIITDKDKRRNEFIDHDLIRKGIEWYKKDMKEKEKLL